MQCLVADIGRVADVAFGELIQHAHSLHADAGLHQPLREASDRQVPGGAAQLAVLARRADEAQHARTATRSHALPGRPFPAPARFATLPFRLCAARAAPGGSFARGRSSAG
jgi:hypothetical protein